MKTTRYIYRPNDYTVFEEIYDDKFTLQNNIGIKNFEMNEFNTYSYDELIGFGFIECQKEELQEVAEKHELHFDYISWSGRPDGHGGAKGGTMDEFLATRK
jgi:hypothetical protein